MPGSCKPLRTIRSSLTTSSSTRSVRTWLKEWGARKSDQPNINSSKKSSSRPNQPVNPSHVSCLQMSPSPTSHYDPSLSMTLDESFNSQAAYREAHNSPPIIGPVRRPTGLRIKTSGLDDIPMEESQLTVRLQSKMTGQGQGYVSPSILDTHDDVSDFRNQSRGDEVTANDDNLNLLYPSTPMNPSQFLRVECPLLISPDSGYTSSSGPTSCPNSFSVLSPSPIMQDNDAMWFSAISAQRQHHGDFGASQIYSPADSNAEMNMRHPQFGIDQNMASDSPIHNTFGGSHLAPQGFEGVGEHAYHQPAAQNFFCPPSTTNPFTTTSPYRCPACGSDQAHFETGATYGGVYGTCPFLTGPVSYYSHLP